MAGGTGGLGPHEDGGRLLDRLERLLELEFRALVSFEPARTLELVSERLELQQRLSEIARSAPGALPADRLAAIAGKNRRNLRLARSACSVAGTVLQAIRAPAVPTYGSARPASPAAGVLKTVA